MKLIQAHFGKIPEDRQKKTDANRAFAKKHGFDYQLYTKWPKNVPRFYKGDDKTIMADEFRFRLATVTPDMVWADTDCQILDTWKMVKDKPYFPKFYLKGRAKGVDHFMFAVNGNTEWFEWFWDEFCRRQIQWVYGFPRKITRDQDIVGNIRYIPNKCWDHPKWERK